MAVVKEETPSRYTFAELPYQRELAQALARSLARGRPAHAYLFAGPRGVGKEAVAYAFGAAALCSEKPLVGCGECNTCRRAFGDLHPDFRRYEVEGLHFDIDKVREILAEAGRPPSESGRKVLLVVEPEKMTYRNDAPANALLKTLEEPPGRAVFILLSHDPRRLLATVVSRCVNVRFPLLSASEVEKALAAEEGFPAERAAAAARLAEGTLAGARAAVDEEHKADVESALALLEELARGGAAAALHAATGARGRKGREEALALVAALAELSHDVAAVTSAAPELVRRPQLEGRVRALAESGKLKPPEVSWEALARAAAALHANCNVALTLEELLLSLVP